MLSDSIIAYPVLVLVPFYQCPPLLLCSCYTGPLLFFTYIRYVTSLKILVLVRSSRYGIPPDIPSFTHFSCSMISLSTYISLFFFQLETLPSPSVFCDINVVSYTLENVSILVCITRLKLCISMLCHQKSALPFSSPLHVLHVFPI